MALKRDYLEVLIFGTGTGRRYTQDSPVMPDVWLEYGEHPDQPIDLLLIPHNESRAGALARELEERLAAERRTSHWQGLHAGASRLSGVAYNQSTVAVELYFDELVRVVLPMTKWWRRYVWRGMEGSFQELLQGDFRGMLGEYFSRQKVQEELAETGERGEDFELTPDLLWMMEIVGTIAIAQQPPKKGAKRRRGAPEPSPEKALSAPGELPVPPKEVLDAIAELLKGLVPLDPEAVSLVWSVNRNRSAVSAVSRSTLAVKADAARRLFELSCKELRWAVIDSGVDARHPAFRCRDKEGKPLPLSDPGGPEGQGGDGDFSQRTRIVATYDFTRARDILRPGGPDPAAMPPDMKARWDADPELAATIKESFKRGREVDWELLKELIEIPHKVAEYRAPKNEHGTHVAGILAGDWRHKDERMPEESDLPGVCPDLYIYDLRVLKDDGSGDEFAVMSALQFVRHLNAHKDLMIVHGANCSLSIKHDVANYACGRTPVCEECERLINAGVVVVAAAGNLGYGKYLTPTGQTEGYNSISITDPGNADGVITVGATHRYRPHTYGVSYFSSRGPTGDGRNKPDLVAPGEKIVGPIPNEGVKRKDGTSMAAPHVSGAAALLMARYSELIGEPRRIKRILCDTATDLGRERYFQGCGMLDVLRALQSV